MASSSGATTGSSRGSTGRPGGVLDAAALCWTSPSIAANLRAYNNAKSPRPMIPNDPRPFDFALGESADMIRESARNFADKEIAPRAAAIDRDNLFPRDLWPKMGAQGLHGITAPEEYGGLGLGYLEHCVAMEEVSRASG